MKAKIKNTGEIVNVDNLYDDGTALVNGEYIKVSKLNFFETIDWDQRRYELAKEYSKAFVMLQPDKGRIDCGFFIPSVAEWSVQLADAIIEQLKNTEEEKE